MIKKRLAEIEARRLEIRTSLETDKNADLDALENEVRELELEEKVQILQEKLEEKEKSASLQTIPMDSSSQNEMEDDALEAASFDSDEAAAPVEDGTLSEASAEKTGALYDVILRVKPQKLDQIKSEIIDGKKCIIIPMEEDEQANVNGITTF